VSYLNFSSKHIGLKLILGVAVLSLVVVVVSVCACVGWAAHVLYNFTYTKPFAGVPPPEPLWHDRAGSAFGCDTAFALSPEK